MRFLMVYLFLMDKCLYCRPIGVKIVGPQAKSVNITEVPYTIEIRVDGRSYCGGTIIGPEWIVTSAHCVASPEKTYLYEILAGDSRRDRGTVHPVSKIIPHKLYDEFTGDYDIAVVNVSKPFQINKHTIDAAALPAAGSTPRPGTMAKVSGWGAWLVVVPNLIELPAFHLRATDVPIFDKKKCAMLYKGYTGGEKVTNRNICAGYIQGGNDACSGDSGGPLVIKKVLVGIISWGYGCGRRNYPGVYVDVGYFRKWIRSNTGI